MRLEDKASQASGSNRSPKKSLLSKVKKDYMKARTILGSVKSMLVDAKRRPGMGRLATISQRGPR
jgi:hypothetical protein